MAQDPKSEIRRLVEGFAAHRESYAHPSYKEAQLRREFIDPMWKALGWDVDNTSNYAEQYKDVIHEDAIKISADAYTKAPDYCFRIGGVRKFFLEAKKPSVDVSNDPAPAFQLRRYAWSAKMPLSVLTDFEELVVYDTRVKPDVTDKASAARIMAIPFTDYVARWEELEGIFSREAVLKGSFDKYADSNKKKRGTASVDAAFLDEIEGWRDELARNIANRNDEISQPELNFAVQVIIDRIVFLRICEDRGIEEYATLLGTSNGANIYPRLVELFRRADKKYNSGLFHFSQERGRTAPPDSVTPDIEIDDAVLKKILRSLYYPESPYEFAVLPADILGQVYEQFLGKVIRLTPGHQAKVEEKPEVKKAGGVFYTPTYIVDYIVTHTIGPLLAGKTPKQITGGRQGPLRILDPACGSGTFLLQAYQYLLNWYRDAYVAEDVRKHSGGRAPVLFQAAGGEWRLTTSERKRVLLTHIFGVDIDSQAVEVTKLSLLLKVLEGESDQTLQRTLHLFQERALPDLDENVKSGNSLIGPEFYEQGELGGSDKGLRSRVNAFDWQREFSNVFTNLDSGFDAIVGNPPYIRIQTLKEWYPEELNFYKTHFVTASQGNFDLYLVFVEQGLKLLNKRGRLGFILPTKFFTTDYGEQLRNLIVNERSLSRIIDFGSNQVFRGATTYTCLLFLKKEPSDNVEYAKLTAPDQLCGSINFRTIHAGQLDHKPWMLGGVETRALAEKIRNLSKPLLDLPSAISRGSSSGADDVFCLVEEGTRLRTRSGNLVQIESSLLRKPLYATDFAGYSIVATNPERIIFPYIVSDVGYEPIDEAILRRRFPKGYRYLSENRQALEDRAQFSEWYAFSAPRSLHLHDSAQLAIPLLARKGSAAVLPSARNQYCLMASGGFSIRLSAETQLSPFYVLGLINSSLLFWNLG